jgi:hypothetical protein
MIVSNRIEIIYRLQNRVVLSWPMRPNRLTDQSPSSYNVYWDSSLAGAFTTLLATLDNNSSGSSLLFNKRIKLNISPSLYSFWDNDKTNYVRLKAVVGGAEQSFEQITAIPPYTVDGMRLHYPELRTTAIIGYNKDENRFIPVNVDANGKIITTT